jgi:hypothetical protein
VRLKLKIASSDNSIHPAVGLATLRHVSIAHVGGARTLPCGLHCVKDAVFALGMTNACLTSASAGSSSATGRGLQPCSSKFRTCKL